MTLHILCLLAQTPVPPAGPDDDFAPMLLPVMLLLLAICLVLIGVGIVLALVGAACMAALVALGIVSSSAAVALWRRQATAGVRALHYQVCAAVGAPAGVVAWWAALALSGREMSLRWIVLYGLAAGTLAGLALAATGDWALRTAYRRLAGSRESIGR